MEKKNTLLIVDDLEMNRAILSNIFKKKYEIVEVASGIEALEYIRENSNKIVSILLDLVMPEMNGIEVLKMMKSEQLAEGVPVFIITADNSEEVMYEAYELGVKDIIEKPFVPYFLRKRIENVIELYEIKEEQRQMITDRIESIEHLCQDVIKLLSKNDSYDKKIEKDIEIIKENIFKILDSLA
ncbi:response regulator [uncultured Fusobacterium sp.]|uniref:response regulator n=1 Tax=uncultured Fusobacterium sp. TaxID=159267 RepID=UPI0025D5204D|nr:response regulator [uncultured Fusobacterium sp.]